MADERAKRAAYALEVAYEISGPPGVADIIAAEYAELRADSERYAFIRDTLAHSEGAFEDIPPMWSFRHLPGRHPTFDAALTTRN